MKGIYTTSARDYNIFASSDDWDKIYDQKVQIQDGKSGRRLRELNGGKASDVGIVPAVGFSFDGNLVAMTGFEKRHESFSFMRRQRDAESIDWSSTMRSRVKQLRL